MQIASLCHYPVKGLSPQHLDHADLEQGKYFPNDRLFALEHGPSGYDPDSPVHRAKTHYLMLARNAALAGLKSHYDVQSGVLSLQSQGIEIARQNMHLPEGRAVIAQTITHYLGEDISRPVTLLACSGNFRFTDAPRGYVSLINLASVDAIGTALAVPLNPLRFRGNIMLSGLAAWEEAQLIGATLAIGEARLRILAMTDRCAATSVNPDTGERDVNIVKTLQNSFGHIDCGVYASIIRSGRISTGDVVRVL